MIQIVYPYFYVLFNYYYFVLFASDDDFVKRKLSSI